MPSIEERKKLVKKVKKYLVITDSSAFGSLYSNSKFVAITVCSGFS